MLPAPDPAAPRLTPDRYTGRTLNAVRGRHAGHALKVLGRWYGSGFYLVLVDGGRRAWAYGAALRAEIDRQDALPF